LGFEVLVPLAVRDGELDEEILSKLIDLFRPDREGILTVLDFAKSVDTVYKELKMLRANVANASKVRALVLEGTCALELDEANSWHNRHAVGSRIRHYCQLRLLPCSIAVYACHSRRQHVRFVDISRYDHCCVCFYDEHRVLKLAQWVATDSRSSSVRRW
jgi:hypothetical protein